MTTSLQRQGITTGYKIQRFSHLFSIALLKHSCADMIRNKAKIILVKGIQMKAKGEFPISVFNKHINRKRRIRAEIFFPSFQRDEANVIFSHPFAALSVYCVYVRNNYSVFWVNFKGSLTEAL